MFHTRGELCLYVLLLQFFSEFCSSIYDHLQSQVVTYLACHFLVTNMPKRKSKETLPSSGSESDEPTPKKGQKAAAKKKSGDENDVSDMFALSKQRFVNVRDFRGKVLIDIREYYEPEVGDLKPGKKGISLTVDQWRKLVNQVDDINARIEEMA